MINNTSANPDYKKITQESYDNTAEEYSGNTQKLGTELKAQSFLSVLKPDSHILDLGCGPGRDANYFISKGYEVTGVDISSKMVEIAKRAAPEATFVVSDIEGFSYSENTYDAVWASASLLHIPKSDFASVLTKIRQCLKPKGIFYLSMKKGQGEELKPDMRYGGQEKFWNYVEEEELVELVKTQGFQILEHTTYEQSTNYQTHPWIALLCKKSM